MTPPERAAAPPLDVFRCALDGVTLIEASAGTGKTWNICALVLRLLLERQLEVQQILVVTFTNAATAELRERIRARIAQTLARLRGSAAAAGDPFVETLLEVERREHGLDDATMRMRLELALQTFDEASIFTIHGFCQRALADAPFTSGMPALELLTDDSLLRQEVVNDFWRNELGGEAVAAGLGTQLLARRDSPERLAPLLARQLAKPLSRLIWPEGIDAAPRAADMRALVDAHAAARASWLAERAPILACVDAARDVLPANIYKDDTLKIAAQSWDLQLASDDPLAAPAKLGKLELLTPQRFKPKKGQTLPRDHDFFEQAGALLQALDAVRTELDLERLRWLRRLLTEGPTRLRALKRERRVVAFDDMLFNLHRQLCGGDQPALAQALRGRFAAALIDEFQDTDPLQFAIFDALYGAGTAPLFLVGDPKQAIYSFRNADLDTYLAARSRVGAEYTLAENQRCTRELLAATNGLFTLNPAAFVEPGIGYPPVALGAKPRPRWADRSAVPRAPLQLWQLPLQDDGLAPFKSAARPRAVQACAGEIARLLDAAQRGQITLDERALAGGDIAVLVRSHAQGAEMRRALAARGVASVELAQASVFHSVDADDLAQLLTAIVEPGRDRLLRRALATDLLGFDAAAIEAIAADESAWLSIVDRFAGYRDRWRVKGIGAMLRALTLAEGIQPRLLLRSDGERRLTNLLHLGEALQQAAPAHESPERLLHWLQMQRQETRPADAAQLRLESDRNLVQIVTIHKAKGLEFPVVFCPLLWDGHAGGSPSMLEGREYIDDARCPVIDFGPGGETEEVKERVALARNAENLRLIYVALTRAVQRCYLVVGPYRIQSGSTAESNHSPLNWLVAGAGMTPQQWRKSRLDVDAIAQAWQGFAAAHPGCVALDALPDGPWPYVALHATSPAAIAALAPPARIAAPWWIGSFSSLATGARNEAAAVDHDDRVAEADPTHDPAAAPPMPDDDDDDIVAFPRGASAGNCLHAVFERVRFDDRATWPAAVDAALRLQPQRGRGDDATGAKLPRMLMRMLDDVLNTSLPFGATLATVSDARRRVEMEFNLPAARLSAGALAAALADYGYPVPTLAFDTLEGYLRGFIDLVFEHEGRFYIVDWKSNHLGTTSHDYRAEALARAMTQHGYPLQALLYTVALHRLLAQRIADYDYERHFGATIYLFVRGVRPHWHDAAGAPAGVHHDRPPRALIERLSALLGPAADVVTPTRPQAAA